ncbi:Integrator complex subunit 1 [Mortierella polycephala]|uniref:Integrator complex subunit 1 n=1 Tax=Mortierella polycephala TaxID=41804 RepID=A0A9P6PVD9_9FUNG|nr:Integrator complex subunit 1 [Mortierella polycephala]
MSKDPRKGKIAPADRNLTGRAPTRPIKSSSILEQLPTKGSANASTSSTITHTPPFDPSSHSTPESSSDGASMPVQKRVRLGSVSSSGAPSTHVKIKSEEPALKSALKKAPGSQQYQYQQYQQQQQQQQYQGMHARQNNVSLWSLTRDIKLELETSKILSKKLDEEVYKTFTQQSWQEPPPLQHIRLALHYLKYNVLNPDPVITSGLLRLGQAMPDLLREHVTTTMMIQMLRPEFTNNHKIRTNGAVVFLVCSLLHLAWDAIEDWPTDFIMVYLEDALGTRSWCAIAETEKFVRNVLTGFQVDDPMDDAMEERFDPVRLDERSSTSTAVETIDLRKYTGSLTLRKRYQDPATRSNIKAVTLSVIDDQILSATGSSATDLSVRAITKVMLETCRWVEVRSMAMVYMETWLGNFTKHAKPLLRQILYTISAGDTLSSNDVETWTRLLDFRYRSRSYHVDMVREEIRMAIIRPAGQELVRTGLRHIMASEMNPTDHRNPYHLDLMVIFVNAIPEQPAVEFGYMVQGCLIEAALQMGASDSLPAQMSVMPVVKRWVRHFGKLNQAWNIEMVEGLLKDGPQLARLVPKHEAIGVRGGRQSAWHLWVQLLTETLCNVMMTTALDEDIKACKFMISEAHVIILRWFQAMVVSGTEDLATVPSADEICRTPYGVIPLEGVLACITRVLFLDPPETYVGEISTREVDTGLISKVVDNGLPLKEASLMALLNIRLPATRLLELLGNYVARATNLTRVYAEGCIVKNPDAIVKIFNLSRFNETSNLEVLKLAHDIPLAWKQHFWTCCLIVAMLASCNPRVLALIVWDSIPVIRTLLEMCISQHYSFPPPNYTSYSEPSAERLMRLQIQADQDDRKCVLAWEREALIVEGKWDEQRHVGGVLRPNESEYVAQLMVLDFGLTQPARAPPDYVLQQLRGLNEQFGLGMRLASSRDPDYLGRMVNSNGDAAWVDRLLRDVPEILNSLPASTLCARFCRSVATTDAGGRGHGTVSGNAAVDLSIKRKLVGYLEGAKDPNAWQTYLEPALRFREARDILEFFLTRLCPSPTMTDSQSTAVIEETKIALDILLDGPGIWRGVLLQTVLKTHGTGFLSKVLQWVESIIAVESDVNWIDYWLDFLLQVESRDPAENALALEQSLLTVARLMTKRLFVFNWVLNDRDALMRRVMKRMEGYLANQDSIMEEKTANRDAAPETVSSKKVQVELSDGMVLNTFPEILRLALLVLSIGDIGKQDFTVWGRLFMASSMESPMMPKRCVDGTPLLFSDSPIPNELQLRLRVAQFSKDSHVVRVAIDGLTVVQVIGIATESFGVDLETAEIIHESLLTSLETAHQQNVPVHLEQSTRNQLMVLLKYHADQGGQWSQKALEYIKARFAVELNSSSTSSSTVSHNVSVTVPNFFGIAAR